MQDAFVLRVQQAIAAHHLLTPKATVVVAVSGGPDSVALLHVLIALKSSWHLTLHLAHLDHGLRQESAEDAQFVEALAARWHIPTTLERCNVAARCAREGWSIEDGARRLRYEFLREVAKRQGASVIAFAHTADDQAETVLMRLMRGTGLLGLGAIPMTRPLDESVWLVRPLLEVWRREVMAYVKRAHLPYREDTTNRDSRFVRNRIRHELLPLLERDYNPNIKHVLTQLAEQSRWDYAFLQEAAGRQWKRLVKGQPIHARQRQTTSRPLASRRSQQETQSSTHVSLCIEPLLRQPKALQRQLVRRAIQRVRGDVGQLEFRHWLEVERLLTERPEGTILDLPGGVHVRRENARLVCQRSSNLPPAEFLEE